MAEKRSLSIIVIPDGSRDSRTFRISYARLRVLAALAAAAVLLITGMGASWWYLAVRASQAMELEERVAEMEQDQARVAALASRLQDLEERYARIRGLFGVDTAGVASDLWLPPPAAGGRRGRTDGDLESGTPSSWPLTERGYVTQPLLERAGGDHPGLDIAVPTGSYIRAAGAGTVVDVGEEDVYGRYVVIDHGNGYRTRYAHASETLVAQGQRVRRNEVIALSGSTGRSTAPHLHFEILLNGEPVDPLTMVNRP